MPTKSLGTLTLDLIAKVGGFEVGMDKAGRKSKSTFSQIERDVNKSAKVFAGFAASSVAGLAALTVSVANNAKETQNLAKVANASNEEFQRGAFAVRTLNIEQDKYADILKDTSDKLGDFLQTGAGPMADFFENIAPQVGVTAEEFANLSGPQALQLYTSSLEKANLNQAEMTFYMEAIASDATLLLPLLKNNGAEFARLGDEAERTGNIISDVEFKELEELTKTINGLKVSYTGLSNEVALAAVPAINDLVELLSDEQTVQNAATLGNVIVKSVTAAVNAISEAVNVTRFLAEEFAALLNGPAADDIGRIEEDIKSLQDRIESYKSSDLGEGFFEQLFGVDDAVKRDLKDFENQLDGLIKKRDEYYESQNVVSAFNVDDEVSKLLQDGSLFQFSPGVSASKRNFPGLNKGQEDLLKGLKEEAALLGLTSTEQEIYKLKAEGATDAQIAQANSLLATIDAFQSAEDTQENYKALLEELQTEEERLTQQMKDRLSVLDEIDGISAGERGAALARIASDVTIDSPVFQIGEDVDEATRMLQNWYDTQLEMLDQFRSDRADLNATWDEEELALRGEYEEKLTALHSAAEAERNQMLADGYSALLGVVGSYYDGMEGEQAAYVRAAISLGQALLDEKQRESLKSIVMNTYDAAMGAYNALASIPYVGPFLGAGAAAAVVVAGTAAAAKVSGIAHEGIDSIPETGTWLLEKGERVTTERTSAKLDKTLEDIRQNRMSGGGPGGGGVRIVNAFDSQVIEDFMGSDAGERVIMNVASRNQSTFKQWSR